MNNTGKLYGVGVGPGDPELITVKAVRVIKAADIIFTAASSKNSYSLAVDIAAPYISESTTIETLKFPMTKDEIQAESAWTANAEQIARALTRGLTVVFLTLGDPVTYSTFGYILKTLKQVMPQADIETIPGITSFHAAAARINRILVEGEESLLVTSGAFGGRQIRLLQQVENIAIVKAYKNIPDINAALKEAGMHEKGVAIAHCGREKEAVFNNLDYL